MDKKRIKKGKRKEGRKRKEKVLVCIKAKEEYKNPKKERKEVIEKRKPRREKKTKQVKLVKSERSEILRYKKREKRKEKKRPIYINRYKKRYPEQGRRYKKVGNIT